MIEIKYYRADDGTEFEEEEDCLNYESGLKLQSVEGELFLYDCDGEPIPLNNAEIGEIEFIHCVTPRALDAFTQFYEIQGCYMPDELRNSETPMYSFYDYRDGVWNNLKEEYENLNRIAEIMGARSSSFIFGTDK
jgi:hypothetical protein